MLIGLHAMLACLTLSISHEGCSPFVGCRLDTRPTEGVVVHTRPYLTERPTYLTIRIHVFKHLTIPINHFMGCLIIMSSETPDVTTTPPLFLKGGVVVT